MCMRTFVFASPGGEALSADAYLPASGAPAPAIIAMHGGSWRSGVRGTYQFIGKWLAERGYATFSIDYRLLRKDQNRYPTAVDDVRTAIRYVREHAAELNVDPSRIVLMGDSAGAHLAALVGLTERPQVKAVVGIVGVYDLVAQWQHDLPIRPNDSMTRGFLGVHLPENRQLYFDASPISHAITANVGPSFLIAWGRYDDIVDPVTQAESFLLALKQAGIWVRPVIQNAPHFWIGDPLDEPGSHSAYFAWRLLRFLDDRVRNI
jgi:acetyl esterase/lipase